MKNRLKKILPILLCLIMILAIFLPLALNPNVYGQKKTRAKEHDPALSPDKTLSGMSIGEIIEINIAEGEPKYSEPTEWEKFSCWAQKALTYENHTLLGLLGSITYYFDSEDKLIFYAFTPHEAELATLDMAEFKKLCRQNTIQFYTSHTAEKASGGKEELYCYDLTSESTELVSDEFLSWFYDSETGSLFIYQSPWGVSPMPEASLVSKDWGAYTGYEKKVLNKQ